MKSAMVAFNGASWAVLLLAGMLMFVTTSAYVVPYVASGIAKDKPGYYSGTLEGQNPEYILQTLSRLRQALLAEEDLEHENTYESTDEETSELSRRGLSLDFGTERDQSGRKASEIMQLLKSLQNPDIGKREYNTYAY